MSFILDALKKAESERNRRVAPVLMDARIAPPRRGLPPWAWLLGAVLVANLAVLGWLLWREPVAAPRVAVTVDGQPRDAAAPTAPARPATVSSSPALPAQPGMTTSLPDAVAASQASGGAVPPPVSAPAPVQQPPAGVPAPVPRASLDVDSLPRLHELRAAGIALPDLQLHLHAYDPAPSHRSVLLNGHRLREGEYTPDGVKVERITPAGAVLEASGRRFRLDVAD
jgi:general secretion pathway protein B